MPCAHVHVTGIVQGVGYRPFVWKTATSLGLRGWVRNASDGVHIEVEGGQAAIDALVLALSTQKPSAARVDTVHVDRIPGDHLAGGGAGFRIVESDAAEGRSTLISPDIATCPACLTELFDPKDRRYHYPFINCTNCGPRFTVIADMPYDRANTSMAGFAMCPDCAREYADPSDRRFHAQPDACFECGPHLSWRTAEKPGVVLWGSDRAASDDIVERAAELLRGGGIVAVKGLGGFHLACDATNEEAVARLRERKHRPAKPLAVMFGRADELRQVVAVSDEERAVLVRPSSPIVLLRRKPADQVPARLRIAPSVAGTLPELGCMLPYTPLQHLLLRAVGRPLVMTSGNLTSEPIICDDQLAVARLMDVADAWLGNNRPIKARYDDSVLRVMGRHVQTVRRARGMAPTPVRLPALPRAGEDAARESTPQVLACGPEQKATFCLTRGDEAFVSQHIGDLENAEAFDAWRSTLNDYARLFGLAPQALACDLHPEYLSAKWARAEAAKGGLPLVEVQHHHAHIAAVLGENDVHDTVVGVALDGTGYGPDGALWGCEVLICNQTSYQRAAHLAYWPLPGGAAAVRKPVRNAYGLLLANGLDQTAAAQDLVERMGVDGPVVRQMVERNLNCPRTGSAGRLFDAVAALLGLLDEASYDGEPACLLEAHAQTASAETDFEAAARYHLTLRPAEPGENPDAADESFVLDPKPLLAAIVEDLAAEVDTATIARRFQDGFVAGLGDAVSDVADAANCPRAAFGGGVFANRSVLTDLGTHLVRDCRLKLYVPDALPFNDGAVAYGQAVVARARIAQGFSAA